MKPSTNLVALLCIVGGVALTVFIFELAHGDSGLKMAALVSATTTVGSIISIAAVILTGKDVTHPEVPPNSTVQQTSTTTLTTPSTSTGATDEDLPK